MQVDDLSEKDKLWRLCPGWLGSEDSNLLFKQLDRTIGWQRPKLHVFGHEHIAPRMSAFLSDAGITYVYSGFKHLSTPWPNWFRPILNKVSKECNVRFNGCLLNYYRNGDDHMGWHSDKEKELRSHCPIASLSLGASRDFFFKNVERKFKVQLKLKDGDLLIMKSGCQENWIHALPARKKVDKPRLNLTFRCFKI